MLTYENLTDASDRADNSPLTEGADWGAVEGVDYRGLTLFGVAQAVKDAELICDLSPYEAMAYGVVVGVRCANLATQE